MQQNTALIIVDVQQDYFPGGKMPLNGADEAARSIKKLLDYFRETNQLVIHIQHIFNNSDAPYLRAGTPGIDIHTLVSPIEGELVITKDTPSAFHETPLLAELQAKHITQLVIAGMMTQTCINATVHAAKDYGFTCLIAADGTSAADMLFEAKAIPADVVRGAILASLSIHYATVLPTNTLIHLLQEEVYA